MGYPQPDRRYDAPMQGSYPQAPAFNQGGAIFQGSFPERKPEIDIESEIRKYIDPANFLNMFMEDRGILEQNKEVMGYKEQVLPRYANPADGTLNNTMVAADPGLMPGERPGYGPATPMEMRDSILERLAPGGLQRARDVLYGRTPLKGV